MALFRSCSASSPSFPQVHKSSPILKPFRSETLMFIPMALELPPISLSANRNFFHPSLPRVLCTTSMTSPIAVNRPDSVQVFVKGLSLSTSEGRLRKALSQFGEVNRVNIGKDKKTGQSLGFAYIWFIDEESAQLAVKEMNGKFFDGRFVLVTIAKEIQSNSHGKARPYKF